MGFAERAVAALVRSIEDGTLSEARVRDVLRSKGICGSFAVGYLKSNESMVRWLAARIVSEKGPVEALVVAAGKEQDRSLLLDMMRMLGKLGNDVGPLEPLLSSDDMMVREMAAEMFHRAGKDEYLFPMVFAEDEAVARRMKRLLDEKGKNG